MREPDPKGGKSLRHWIELLLDTGTVKDANALFLLNEVDELVAIAVSSIKTAKEKLKKTNIVFDSQSTINNKSGSYPSGQRGQAVNLLTPVFSGSNPLLPTFLLKGMEKIDCIQK